MNNEIIKIMKNKCHERFDSYWKSQLSCKRKNHINKIRRGSYHKLAQEMMVSADKSHFKNMNDTKTLLKAFKIILSWNRSN